MTTLNPRYDIVPKKPLIEVPDFEVEQAPSEKVSVKIYLFFRNGKTDRLELYFQWAKTLFLICHVCLQDNEILGSGNFAVIKVEWPDLVHFFNQIWSQKWLNLVTLDHEGRHFLRQRLLPLLGLQRAPPDPWQERKPSGTIQGFRRHQEWRLQVKFLILLD